MAITVELSSGQRIVVESESATVGSDQSCDISLPDVKQLQPRHAQIRKVANKWMIESSGDWLLQVGDGVPGRKCWLSPGDVIHLTESGPLLIFAPPDESSAQTDAGRRATETSVDRPKEPLKEERDDTPKEWFYSQDGKQVGPITYQQLQTLAASGRLDRGDPVWSSREADRKPASTLTSLFPTSQPTIPPPLPPQSTSPPPLPTQLGVPPPLPPQSSSPPPLQATPATKPPSLPPLPRSSSTSPPNVGSDKK